MLSETAFPLLRAVSPLALASLRYMDIHGEVLVIFISPYLPIPSVIYKGNALAYCLFPKWPLWHGHNLINVLEWEWLGQSQIHLHSVHDGCSSADCPGGKTVSLFFQAHSCAGKRASADCLDNCEAARMLVASLCTLHRLFQRFWCAKHSDSSMKIREGLVIFCAGYDR